jgi:hypothetical protein
MSADPAFDLQAAVVPLLRADAALNEFIGGRVYDDVEPTAQFPYVSIGPATVTTNDTDDCMVAYEVVLLIDVWARGSGNGNTYEAARPQMQRIAGTLRRALHAARMTLENHRLLQIRHAETLSLRVENDPKTAHAAMTFRALIHQV